MAELQEVEVNSNCKHLIASINSYVCFLYLIMHTLLFKYYGSLKRRIMVDKRHVFGEFMISLLCLGNKKKMCLFSEGKDQNRNWVFFLYNVQRDKIAMVSQCSIVRGWQKLDRADEYQVQLCGDLTRPQDIFHLQIYDIQMWPFYIDFMISLDVALLLLLLG